MTTTTTTAARAYPRAFPAEGGDIELRLMTPADEAAVLAFAARLPEHDLLFLPRDISQPKVVAAWAQETERGAITSVLGVRGAVVMGCATIVHDPLSWSRHVGELRLVVAADARGKGLGQRLAQEAFALAVDLGLEKFSAQMTVDQTSAIAVFQAMGFRPEALLRDHVKDRSGHAHDMVVLGCDVARFQARVEAYGAGGAD